ncbi:MAG: adenosylcobinamide amidohydrolase [Deltaproteobacteria bacterium]|jgi:adenosylcobinamide amidohydrolase|nr:adenosylcobinamide amidohydrolase [Deltaproteobacteria bacterium]
MELRRGDKVVYARLDTPHAVLSTARANGGYRADLLYLLNHQVCEPSGHGGGKAMLGYTDPGRYLEDICQRYGLGPASRCAALSTAANMRLCAVEAETYRELTVAAAVTAGVEGNAGRAGDPASGYEGRNGYEAVRRLGVAEEAHPAPGREGQAHPPDPRGAGSAASPSAAVSAGLPAGAEGGGGPPDVARPAPPPAALAGEAGGAGARGDPPDPSDPPPHGTINTLLFISLPVTPGCLTRAVMTATEAKTAALQELNINSRYSDGLATGTGTDQIAVAARFLEGFPPLSSAGKHAKLGELVGVTVKAAVKGALQRQNGLSPSRQCSAKILLERLFEREGVYRITRDEIAELFSRDMDPETAALFQANSKAALCDPAVAAAVAALMHLRDQFSWGTFPPLLWPEIMGAQAALLAAAAGGDLGKSEGYRGRLAGLSADASREGFTRLVGAALAMGYSDKWEKGI